MSENLARPDGAFPDEACRAQAQVLVVGDVMLDRYWFGEVNRISPEAPVPVVHVRKNEDRLGGAANVARNAASLGAQVKLIGIIGQDEAGNSLEQLGQQAGIQNRLLRDPHMPTIMKMRVLGHQQQMLRIDVEQKPSQAMQATVLQAFAEAVDGADIVVFSDYAKGALNGIADMIALARASGCVVLVDPKGNDYDKYRGASILTPNRSEMRDAIGSWSDEDTLAQGAEHLRSHLDLDALLLTRSEQGMSLFTERGADHVEALTREVFDVSGAGDTVIATVAVMRACGLDWPQAMRWANLAGSVVVSKLGTSVVTPQELQQARHKV